jgi:hypothetical protein
MRAHPGADDLGREGIYRFGRQEYGLHACGSGSTEQCAKVAWISHLVGDQNEIQGAGYWLLGDFKNSK